MLKQIVDARVITPTGLSVATGLAMETLFDVGTFDSDRKSPSKVDPTKYPTHVYNISTLYRNVLGSIKYKDKELLMQSKYVQDQLINDIYVLMELYSNTEVKLLFYLPDYSNVGKKYNKYKTGIYKPYEHTLLMQYIINKLVYPVQVTKSMSDGLLPRISGKVLLMTHHTYDLLSVFKIPELTLLESHTGRIKTKSEWGKKYKSMGKRDMSHYPINKRLLYIYGDKTIVQPLPISDRKGFYELSATKGWSPSVSQQQVDTLTKSFMNKIPV